MGNDEDRMLDLLCMGLVRLMQHLGIPPDRMGEVAKELVEKIEELTKPNYYHIQ